MIIRIVVATISNFVAVYRRTQRPVDAISSPRQPHSDIITQDAKHYLQRCVCRYSFMVPSECIGSVLTRAVFYVIDTYILSGEQKVAVVVRKYTGYLQPFRYREDLYPCLGGIR